METTTKMDEADDKSHNDEQLQPQSIPHELIVDIITRLPVKSLTRFRSVSTLWNSTISHPSFSKSHFSQSATAATATTNLLITFLNRFNAERVIFSVTIPPNQTRSDPTPTHLLTIPGFAHQFVSQSLQGLICLNLGALCVCNPSTRKFVKLPWTATETPSSPACTHHRTNAFGFDPVKNEHKVLDTWIICHENKMIMEHRVFVVESGCNKWRRIADGPPHFPSNERVCINGHIYYRGLTSLIDSDNAVMVAFDVLREEFRLIRMPDETVLLSEDDSVLIEHEGRLAVVNCQGLDNGGDSNVILMWVLEDEGKEKWVKKILKIPESWSEMKDHRSFNFAGSTFAGEMIFAPRSLGKPFDVVLYDMKRNELRKVEICGLSDYEFRYGNAVMNVVSVNEHVESIMALS